MIDLYSGTPGSGKSLHAAERIVMRSRFGEPVIGNFPCDLRRYKKANFTYVPNNKLSPDFLIQFSRDHFQGKSIKEGAILLVIDECQLMFNSRDWQKKGREEWLEFFTLHRHLGYDIVLIAQIDRMIDKQIRGLIEYEYVHRKLNNFGWKGILLRCATLGANFVSVKIWYPMKETVSRDIFRAHKRYYSIYDTFASFGSEGVQESQEEAQKEEKQVHGRSISDLRSKAVILLRSLRPKKRQKKFKEKRPKRRSGAAGSYLRPWDSGSLYSFQGKYLRPGGRSETGWKNEVERLEEAV